MGCSGGPQLSLIIAIGVVTGWLATVKGFLSRHMWLGHGAINLSIPCAHLFLSAFFWFLFGFVVWVVCSFIASLLARNLHSQEPDLCSVQTGETVVGKAYVERLD